MDINTDDYMGDFPDIIPQHIIKNTPVNTHTNPQHSTQPQVQPLWRCMSCSSPNTQLYVLPTCQHRFCDKCLHLWVGIYTDTYHQRSAASRGAFPCQVCWNYMEMPEHGLEIYRQDYRVCELEAGFGSMSMHGQEVVNNQVPIYQKIQKDNTQDNQVGINDVTGVVDNQGFGSGGSQTVDYQRSNGFQDAKSVRTCERTGYTYCQMHGHGGF